MVCLTVAHAYRLPNQHVASYLLNFSQVTTLFWLNRLLDGILILHTKVFLIAYYIINDYNLNTRQFVESFSGLKSLSYCCIRASVRNFPYHYLRIGKVSKALLRPFPYTLCVHYEFLMTRVTRKVLDIDIKCIRVRRGVSKRVENGRRPPALRAGYPKNGSKAVTTMVRLQGIEGLGMAGPGEALGSLWPPLAIRPWSSVTSDSVA
jgi:hypothetical protein